jgi:hypothetical protein
VARAMAELEGSSNAEEAAPGMHRLRSPAIGPHSRPGRACRPSWLRRPPICCSNGRRPAGCGCSPQPRSSPCLLRNGRQPGCRPCRNWRRRPGSGGKPGLALRFLQHSRAAVQRLWNTLRRSPIGQTGGASI